MIKNCTDIKQSIKLIKLGISIDSADMTVISYSLKDGGRFEFIRNRLPNDTFPSITDGKSELIPCWSLSALLELLPETICFEDNENDYAIEILIENGLYYLSYGNPLEHDVINVEPQACFIDVCVDMIVKLHEKNLL